MEFNNKKKERQVFSNQMGEIIDVKLTKNAEFLLNHVNEKMECELNYLRKKVTYYENESKRKNFALYGIKETSDESPYNLRNAVLYVLTNIMDSDVSWTELDHCYRLGKRNNLATNRPVLVKCLSQWRKEDIMRKRKNLNGSGIHLEHDLTKKEVSRRKELKFWRREVRASSQF